MTQSVRKERFLKISKKTKFPNPVPQLYLPASFRVLNVTPGETYAVPMTDEELANLIEAGLAVEVPQPESGETYWIPRQPNTKTNEAANVQWEKQTAE